MKEEKLCDAMNLLPEDMIHETEQIRASQKKRHSSWLKWVSAAACLCLVVVGVLHMNPDVSPGTGTDGIMPGGVTIGVDDSGDRDEESYKDADTTLDGNDQTEGPYIPWQPTFNTVSDIPPKIETNSYFTQELSEDDISAIEPGKQIGYMVYSGQAGFDGDGNLVDVQLSVTTTLPENTVSVMITPDAAARDYLFDEELIVSVNSNISYIVCQYDRTDGIVTLTADAMINGYAFSFILDTTQHNLEQAKIDFSEILECFSYYLDGEPDLTSIVAEKNAN